MTKLYEEYQNGKVYILDENYDGAPDAGRQLIGEGDTKYEALKNYLYEKHSQLSYKHNTECDGCEHKYEELFTTDGDVYLCMNCHIRSNNLELED